MKIKNILAGMMMLASLVCISCEKYDAADTVKEKEKVENGVKVIDLRVILRVIFI